MTYEWVLFEDPNGSFSFSSSSTVRQRFIYGSKSFGTCTFFPPQLLEEILFSFLFFDTLSPFHSSFSKLLKYMHFSKSILFLSVLRI